MIILDIETLAVDGIELEPVSAPANYKDPEKIAAYIADGERAQRERAGLYPWTARIIALGWCYDTDESVQVRTTNNEAEESDILTEFWGRVVDQHGSVTPLVTYNGLALDLPVLQSRSTLLGVKAPVLHLDRYRSPHPDLMQLLTYRGAIAARSLTWFAKRFGLDISDAFSGKEIAGLVEDGNWDAIRAHCDSDVRLTRQLAERLGVIRARKG